MMSDNGVLTFSLSQEELFVVLATLDVDYLLGLDNDILVELDENQINLLIGGAERALTARGLTREDAENGRVIDDRILAIVSVCAKPDSTVICTVNWPERVPEALFFHSAMGMHVLHTIPLPGVHQFTTVPEPTKGAQALLSSLPLNDLVLEDCPGGQLKEAALTQARTLAGEKEADKMRASLQESTLPDKTAEALAATLETLAAGVTLISLQDQQLEVKSNGFSLLVGDNGNWILRPSGVLGEDRMIDIAPASRADIACELKSLIGLGATLQ